jgi:predicted metalloprotease
MRWQTGRRSTNVQDYRGRRMGRAGLGIGGTLIALVAAYFLGVDPRLVTGVMESVPAGGQQTQVESGTPTDEQGQFMAAVLADTEDTWGELFRASGAAYQPPTLVLFEQRAESACGSASSAAGPFYCPADQKIYIDLAFYEELQSRFQAPGDFAQAYVLAHEVGHHVQNLAGTASQVRSAQQNAPQEAANQLQVSMELQADCYAGIWAHHANRSRQILEQGDVAEALGAAAAVGDDTIQRQTQGTVVPETFTHGSAEQRKAWFQRGLEQGSLEGCDTFASR